MIFPGSSSPTSGHLITPGIREFSGNDIAAISETYHNWRNPEGDYNDVKGYCNSTSIDRVRELDYVLTPGSYVGLPDDGDNFNERFNRLKTEFEEQLKEEEKLNALIKENLRRVKLNE